jgi:hypothetical protein
MWASREGHTAAAQVLIGAGAHLNLQCNEVSGDTQRVEQMCAV